MLSINCCPQILFWALSQANYLPAAGLFWAQAIEPAALHNMWQKLHRETMKKTVRLMESGKRLLWGASVGPNGGQAISYFYPDFVALYTIFIAV